MANNLRRRLGEHKVNERDPHCYFPGRGERAEWKKCPLGTQRTDQREHERWKTDNKANSNLQRGGVGNEPKPFGDSRSAW